jgi:hypothetical protein
MCNDSPKSLDQLCVALADYVGVDRDHLESILAELTSRRVLYEERLRYFTLAIPEHPYL